MAKLHPQIEGALRDGFDAGDMRNPHLFSSNMWEAFEVGRFMHRTGRHISGLEKGRGYSWKGPAGSVYKVNYGKAGQFTITREG